MNSNNILGAIFISVFPMGYLMSAISMGVLTDDYDTFCKKIQCPDPKNINFDPHVVFQQAKFTIYLGVSGILSLIWTVFYLKDRYYDNRKPLYNSNGVLIDGVEGS